jgi:hypothetical protein
MPVYSVFEPRLVAKKIILEREYGCSAGGEGSLPSWSLCCLEDYVIVVIVDGVEEVHGVAGVFESAGEGGELG